MYQGTLRFASSRVLQAWTTCGGFPSLKPCPVDDFHSWIRVCVYFTCLATRQWLRFNVSRSGEMSSVEELQRLDRYWESVLSVMWPSTLLTAMGSTDDAWDAAEAVIPLVFPTRFVG